MTGVMAVSRTDVSFMRPGRPPRRALLAAVAACLASLALCLPARAEEPSAGQRVAMQTKPAVVRIFDGYTGSFYWSHNSKTYSVSTVRSGSGFFINPDGYIATNAHVAEPTHRGEEKGREDLFTQFVIALARDYNADPQAVLNNESLMRTIASRVQIRSVRHVHHAVIADGTAVPFELKSFGAPVGEGKDVAILKVEVTNAPSLVLGNSEELQLLDPVMVMGYPAAADTFDTGILDERSALEASVTDGKLSARKNTADGAPVLQISAPATHGNSGGPVLNAKGEVVGLLTFRGDAVNGQEVSGFAFVVPTHTLQEFVKSAGVTNEAGAANRRYQEGLALYWGQHYRAAIPVFEEVKRLFPQHPEVDRLIRTSQERITAGKDVPVSPFSGGLLFLGIAGGMVVLSLVGLAGVFGTVLYQRRGKGILAPQPAAAAAAGA